MALGGFQTQRYAAVYLICYLPPYLVGRKLPLADVKAPPLNAREQNASCGPGFQAAAAAAALLLLVVIVRNFIRERTVSSSLSSCSACGT